MIPKKKRVTKKVFDILMKEGKTFSTGLFLFYFKKGEIAQYTFVAPKKAFKNAVLRNKYRRIGYNILRKKPLNKGIGIFIYKKQALNAKNEEIEQNIDYLLKKMALYYKTL